MRDHTIERANFIVTFNDLVTQALMVALAVVTSQVLSNVVD
ncbi:MAG: hypothetical protein QF637_11500 [Acidimicrobiales bacterium]|jgi:hypothetical protein|nr:hypothetical protein [Acidimicrobiales bacterium]